MDIVFCINRRRDASKYYILLYGIIYFVTPGFILCCVDVCSSPVNKHCDECYSVWKKAIWELLGRGTTLTTVTVAAGC